MKLKEVSEIEKCEDEDKPIKILEEIGDKVIFRGYQEEQMIRKYKTQQKKQEIEKRRYHMKPLRDILNIL